MAQAWRTCAGGPGPAPGVSAAAAAPRVRRVVDSVHVSEAPVEASPALAALFTKIYALQNAAIQFERSSDGTLFLVELAEDFRGKRTFTTLATYSPFGHVMWKEALFGAKVPEEHLCMGCSLDGCGHTSRIRFPRNSSVVLDFVAFVRHVQTHSGITTSAHAAVKQARGGLAEYGDAPADVVPAAAAAERPAINEDMVQLFSIMITVGQFPENVLKNPGFLYLCACFGVKKLPSRRTVHRHIEDWRGLCGSIFEMNNEIQLGDIDCATFRTGSVIDRSCPW